ncbi:MAG: GNAT family N-acetyltransferase [Pseudonocardiales bacterium]|nr:MAG: GNAT family N-acetyltransferase [Pseudonocardiales bacterium]
MTRHSRIEVRAACPGDADFVRDTMLRTWESPLVAVHGELIDVTTLPALIAWRDGEPIGLATHRPHPGDSSWEVVSLHAAVAGVGAGTALLDEVARLAKQAGARRIWLVTTNDNVAALRFYQRHGMDLVALHRDAVTEGRRVKPSIPPEVDGIRMRHELELEWLL